MARKRKRKSGSGGTGIAVAAGIGLFLAAHSHGGAGVPSAAESFGAAGVPLSVGAIPAWAGTDRASWARALLQAAGLPVTSANVEAIVIWERAEGGGFGNQAANNPLNINPGSASWPGHQANGAWAFPITADGIAETVRYLRMPNYTAILAALRDGTSTHAVLLAIVTSPWASSHYAGNQVMQQALAST